MNVAGAIAVLEAKVARLIADVAGFSPRRIDELEAAQAKLRADVDRLRGLSLVLAKAVADLQQGAGNAYVPDEVVDRINQAAATIEAAVA